MNTSIHEILLWRGIAHEYWATFLLIQGCTGCFIYILYIPLLGIGLIQGVKKHPSGTVGLRRAWEPKVRLKEV